MPSSSTEYAVDLVPPDLRPWRAGNTGIAYATSFTAAAPGPHALISALVHGNELCGACALDRLMRSSIRPRRGTLTLCFANIAAYARFDPANPTASRFVDEDLNRVWDPATLDGTRDSTELRRAREMRPLLDAADFLLDLHSMQHPTEPLFLAGMQGRGRRLAEAVGVPRLVVMDAGHKAGLRMRDYGPFGEPDGHRTALLAECGQHWARASAAVAFECCLRFLFHLGLIDPADAGFRLPPAPGPASRRVIEVLDAITVASPDFRFVDDFRGMEVVPVKGTIIAFDGTQPVRTPCDDCILIMPSKRRAVGQTAVRLGRFVD